ncbi:unnamed protein product [Darwinula stevensoni]|uniref:Neuropathy target esterase sws n=1 Tax=Darwinula stevensoni TaxID=69355 RepID=A0A7R8XA33_9CRUS|nr:unnamed protein product [Darwinula stevensoni]CAG0883270.1 unnamed protein product [Darwinula stevensoni]
MKASPTANNPLHDEYHWVACLLFEYRIYGIVAVFLVITFTFLCQRLWRPQRTDAEPNQASTRARFRRRDKVLFYGKKMLRKVKNFSGTVGAIPKGRRKQIVVKMAKQLLRLKKESHMPPQLTVLEPPDAYLEADSTTNKDDWLPPEVLYMLRSIRVFGHFEKPVFLELCKSLETLNLTAGDFLFRVGDADENVYVVQEGLLDVYLTNAEGSEISLKKVPPGDAIISLLSFADCLTGHQQPFKTLYARAVKDSLVLRLPVSAFQPVLDRHPESMIRIVEVIMMRLQRVTLTALLQHLGLASKILKPYNLRSDENQEKHVDFQGRHSPGMPSPSKEEDMEAVLKGFQMCLGIDDITTLRGKVTLKQVGRGNTLIHQDSSDGSAIYYVRRGVLHVVLENDENTGGKEKLFVAQEGEILGGLSVLTGEPSYFTIRCPVESDFPAVVGVLSKEKLIELVAERPSVVLHVVNAVIRNLSPVVRQIDFALDWINIEPGKAIYRQGEESDSTYIVLSGRLRSVIANEASGKKELVGEYGRGDLVGIVELLTHTQRSTTVMAIRDTELAKLSGGLLNYLKWKFPSVVTKLIKLLGHRILGTWQKKETGPIDLRPSQSNMNTLAILPVLDDVPLVPFSLELYHSLSAIGPVIRLTSEYVVEQLGDRIFDASNEFRLSRWLGQQEDKHRMVIYECDFTYSLWTMRCVRQADCILIVANASGPMVVGKMEKQLELLSVRTQRELVLLHTHDARPPRNTAAWMNMRSYCSAHHHIRCPSRMFVKRSQARTLEVYQRVMASPPDPLSDFSRLARLLTGTSVGLVLGGGGARGAAHVGMIKAIQDAGIPIDMVGGVSIGAFVGALWCMETDITRVTQKAREWSVKMTQRRRQIMDLTYPITAMFTGKGFNQVIQESLGERNIEDLWIPYFTITTDVTASAMRIHTHGSLWRYVRASMSLSGYMPPLCDPQDGHLLLDGGYVNNLPADVMRSRGAKTIIAVDVGSEDEGKETFYGDSLNGWWLLWNKWWPWSPPVSIPSLADIQSRLAYVSCVRQLEEVKNSDYCEYIRPPIDRYQTLQFGSFDEIKDVGFNHGKAYLYGVMKAGQLSGVGIGLSKSFNDGPGEGGMKRSTSFLGLSQMLSRVSQKPLTIPYDNDWREASDPIRNKPNPIHEEDLREKDK